MRRVVAALCLFASIAAPAQAQVFNHVNLDHLNRKIHGKIIDFTENHGADRRIFSPILGRPRDLYVYLPPAYDPAVAYPLVIYLHGAHIDEHAFIDPGVIKAIDWMMNAGQIPPTIIAAPDGTYGGKNRITCIHSLWVNGEGGRFEDHIVAEIVPFLFRTFSLRPERQSRAILGISASGYGAMTVAMRHRDLFGSVATIGGPLNLRYDNFRHCYSDDFDPATYRERIAYEPELIVARYYCGLLKRRVNSFIGPVYGEPGQVAPRVIRDNPADVLLTSGVGPGELAIHINYPSNDNYNFDAQCQSFAWLAARRGVGVDIRVTPGAQHDLSYIEGAMPLTFCWLGGHLLLPVRRQ